jgi:4-hydroxythreonine-4-phosphate dehydrogenase
MTLPIIGITMGDPTGVGPEIIVNALSMEEPFQACRPIVFGDLEVLSRAIRIQNLSVTIEAIEKIPEGGYLPGKIFVSPVSRLDITSLHFGKPDKACGEAMVRYIEEAVKWVKKEALDAITTCPINKHAMNAAGYSFPGHTELLAHLSGSSRVAMMFLGSKWKIVLVTTHLPIKDVSGWITASRILSTLRLTDEERMGSGLAIIHLFYGPSIRFIARPIVA